MFERKQKRKTRDKTIHVRSIYTKRERLIKAWRDNEREIVIDKEKV